MSADDDTELRDLVIDSLEKKGVLGKIKRWTPTREQWNLALHAIQPEEKTRIERFVFKEDTKSALVGRLLLRRLITKTLQVSNKTICLKRTQHGRPYLEEIPENSMNCALRDFNVSHQGDYCVLAAEASCQVGIDVMKTRYMGGTPIPEFFRLMTRKFTRKEWDFICGPVPELEQVKRFFRLWSLKESFVKADGRGLGFELQRLSFTCHTPVLVVGTSVTDTVLSIDGEAATDWKFQETLLDECHGVAVAQNTSCSNSCSAPFVELTIGDLINNLEVILPQDDQAWENFSKKSSKK